MNITIEKIDLLKERAQISYSEARDLLERFDGNVIEALIHLEQNNQTTKAQDPVSVRKAARSNHQRYHQDGMEKAKGFLNKIHQSRFTLKNKEKQLIDLPLSVASVFTIITMPLSAFLLVGTVLTGYKITIIKYNGKKVDIDKVLNVDIDQDLSVPIDKKDQK